MEVRIHGRGGQGTVKAAEIIVRTSVMDGKYGVSIPFFGFERQGAPVTAFVRLSDRPIRPKTRVYHPDCVIVMDAFLLENVDVFAGLRDGSTVILNAPGPVEGLQFPACVARVGIVDATGIALEALGRNIPNTAMLGAFCAVTQAVPLEGLAACAAEALGEKNAEAAQRGYSQVVTTSLVS